MPKDKRLYMTFPIDMDEHPKIEMLSDSAFRTFFKMNGYSRRQRLDGRIPISNASRRWKAKDLRELLASHEERPLVYIEDGCYVIRSYSEHQFTTEDEAELHERKARAGAAGGRAKAAATAGAKQQPKQDLAESESRSESGILTDVTNDIESSHVPDASASGTENASPFIIARAKTAGVHDVGAVALCLAKATGQLVSLHGAVLLVEAITSKARREVKDVDAYVATVCRRSPLEVQQAYFDLDIGAVA